MTIVGFPFVDYLDVLTKQVNYSEAISIVFWLAMLQTPGYILPFEKDDYLSLLHKIQCY